MSEKVLICIPSAGTWTVGFGMSLLNLSGSYAVTCEVDSAVHASRERMAMKVLETGAHALFLDCDIRFPGDLLERLLGHGLPIVAANCRASRGGFPWTAQGFDGEEISSVGRSGVEQVRYAGGAVMLIRNHVLEKIPQPWFAMDWKNGERRGTDDHFLDKAHEAGVAVWVDHYLSQRVTHRATIEVGVAT